MSERISLTIDDRPATWRDFPVRVILFFVLWRVGCGYLSLVCRCFGLRYIEVTASKHE